MATTSSLFLFILCDDCGCIDYAARSILPNEITMELIISLSIVTFIYGVIHICHMISDTRKYKSRLNPVAKSKGLNGQGK